MSCCLSTESFTVVFYLIFLKCKGSENLFLPTIICIFAGAIYKVMADNYLENRMADYRAGRLSPKPSRKVVRSLPPDALVMRYPSMAVAVCYPCYSELLSAIVSELRSVGMRVAIVCPDSQHCTELAHRSGARYYPGTLSYDAIATDVEKHWGGIDAVIGPMGVAQLGAHTVIETTPAEGINPGLYARLLLFALHPSNYALLAEGAFSGLTLRKSAKND